MDFSKAFDSINQDYIFETIEFFKFGQNFINIEKTMLKDRKCTFMIDGFETRSFKIGRGVPQGDTASPIPILIHLGIRDSFNKNKTRQQTDKSQHNQGRVQTRRWR